MLSAVLRPRHIIKKPIIPILTDISLRFEPMEDLAKKQTRFHEIITTYSPDYIEVGALKVTPIIGDTTPMFQYANDYKRFRGGYTEYYVFVPTFSKLNEALTHNVTHMSFITSVSHPFQQNKMNRTMHETKADLRAICKKLEPRKDIRKKLYISCITECPYAGKLDLDYILHELCKYHHHYSFDELCLSDTHGTLTFENYKYLVDALYVFGVPKSKIGVQLHMKDMKETEQIVRYSLKNGFIRFDISIADSDYLKYDVFMSIYNKVFTNYNI